MQSELPSDGREAIAVLHVGCPDGLIPVVACLALSAREQRFEGGPGQQPLHLRDLLDEALFREQRPQPRHELLPPQHDLPLFLSSKQKNDC